MIKNVYFVRHGETEWNRLKKIQGQADIPLNETRRREAVMAASVFSALHFGRCYVSPLCRAQETARILLKDKDCEIIVEDLVKEIAYGVDEGQNLDEIHQNQNLPLHNYFAAPERYIPPKGGESIVQLKKRCKEFLDYLREEEEKENVLVVCHGALIRGLISIVQGLEDTDFWTGKEQKNCAFTRIRMDNDEWVLEEEAIAWYEKKYGTMRCHRDIELIYNNMTADKMKWHEMIIKRKMSAIV